jgi:hypothetical protein
MYTFGGEKLGKGSSGGRERYVAAVGAMENKLLKTTKLEQEP